MDQQVRWGANAGARVGAMLRFGVGYYRKVRCGAVSAERAMPEYGGR